jgi:hypothetical protein
VTPEELVDMAIEVAEQAMIAGEMPVGAVVAMGDQIIGSAYTQEKTQGRRLVMPTSSRCSKPTSGSAGDLEPRPWSWPSTSNRA